MLRTLLLAAIAFALALLPTAAFAQAEDDEGDFALRIRGDYTVPEGQSVGTLIVIRGNAIVEGTVRDFLLVIDGTADISGTVKELTVVSGDAILRDGATVREDVLLIRSEMDQQPGSTVGGQIERRSRAFFRGAWVVFGVFFWLGATTALVVAGLLFAAIGGRQLGASTDNLSEQPGQSILAAIVVLFVLPVLAVLAMLTIVGIPLGIGVLAFLYPALFFLGFLVAATWVGRLILSGFKRDRPATSLYLPVVIGVLILQVIALIPGVGWVTWMLAALYGMGGLAYLAWQAARGRRAPSEQPRPGTA